MGDPLSIAAGIIACIQATAEVVKYVSAIRHHKEDVNNFVLYFTSSMSRLAKLRQRVDRSNKWDPWFVSIKELGESGGILDKYKDKLDGLKKDLGVDKPTSGRHQPLKILDTLKWPVVKKDIEDALKVIESLDQIIDRALADDLRFLVDDIHAKTTQLLELQILSHEPKALEDQDSINEAILESLTPLEFETIHSQTYKSMEENTGLWILESEEYQAWVRKEVGLLWYTGIPGSGKTTLASLVVESLRDNMTDSEETVLFVYLHYKERTRQTYNNLVGVLISQLLRRMGHIPAQIQTALQKKPKQKGNEKSHYTKILLQLLDSRRDSYIVIDALDECTNDTEDYTLSKIEDLIIELQGKASVMVTSRHAFSIKDCKALELDLIAQSEDVARYVAGRMKRDENTKTIVQTDPSLEDEITAAVIRKSKGMFLLARLHMDSVSAQWSPQAVRKCLEVLPTKISEAYDDTILRLYNKGELKYKLALRVLSWVSLAMRPLGFEELRCALSIKPEMHDFDPNSLPIPKLIIDLCDDLLTIEEGLVSLVQYLKESSEELFPDAEHEIATACLTYLHFDSFESPWGLNLAQWKDYRVQHKLLDYAAVNWGYHLHKAGEPESIRKLAVELARNERKCASACHFLTLGGAGMFVNAPKSPNEKYTGLHMLAHFGLEFSILQLLSDEAQNVDVDSREDFGLTPLLSAARRGATSVARTLLDSGASLEAADVYGRTSISFAAEYGHAEFVEFVASRGLNTSMRTGIEQRTPLIWASIGGHTETLRVLLRKKLDINARDGDRRTALAWAALIGHGEVAKYLIRSPGVQIDCRDANQRTPLSIALQFDKEDIALQLLAAGANVNAQGEHGRSCLSIAAEWASSRAFKACLDAPGANTDLPAKTGLMPLDYALYEVHVGEFEVIRDDITKKDRNRAQTALEESRKVLKMLEDRGATTSDGFLDRLTSEVGEPQRGQNRLRNRHGGTL